MSDDEADAIAAIARAVMRYLVAHPSAADTLIGVQRWWLPPSLDEPLPLVELALDSMIQEGTVQRMEREDGSIIYASMLRAHRPGPAGPR